MATNSTAHTLLWILLSCLLVNTPKTALAEGMFRKIINKSLAERDSIEKGPANGLYAQGENYQGKKTNENFAGRDFVIYQPSRLPPQGERALVVILHGGFGNATQIQSYLGLDPLADKNGFVVAYLNGTKVMKIGSDNMRGWNAGECCGQPQAKNTDDVGYITKTVGYIIKKYGINPAKVYGMGHSNGAMMTQRLMCTTNIFASAIPMSGTLEIDVAYCPQAKGKHILALHGKDDKNMPIEGGYGTESINKKTDYNSQSYTQSVYDKSGAYYKLVILEGADHNPKTINDALIKTKGITLPEQIVEFFGLKAR